MVVLKNSTDQEFFWDLVRWMLGWAVRSFTTVSLSQMVKYPRTEVQVEIAKPFSVISLVFQSFVALLLSSRSSPAVLCFPSHDPKPSSAKHLSSHQQALIFYCCAREAGLISLLIMTCSILVSRRLGPSPILGLQMCLINYLNYSFNCHL